MRLTANARSKVSLTVNLEPGAMVWYLFSCE
jgi:hypothetical protein